MHQLYRKLACLAPALMLAAWPGLAGLHAPVYHAHGGQVHQHGAGALAHDHADGHTAPDHHGHRHAIAESASVRFAAPVHDSHRREHALMAREDILARMVPVEEPAEAPAAPGAPDPAPAPTPLPEQDYVSLLYTMADAPLAPAGWLLPQPPAAAPAPVLARVATAAPAHRHSGRAPPRA